MQRDNIMNIFKNMLCARIEVYKDRFEGSIFEEKGFIGEYNINDSLDSLASNSAKEMALWIKSHNIINNVKEWRDRLESYKSIVAEQNKHDSYLIRIGLSPSEELKIRFKSEVDEIRKIINNSNGLLLPEMPEWFMLYDDEYRAQIISAATAAT